jgi:hypothetical protein
MKEVEAYYKQQMAHQLDAIGHVQAELSSSNLRWVWGSRVRVEENTALRRPARSATCPAAH